MQASSCNAPEISRARLGRGYAARGYLSCEFWIGIRARGCWCGSSPGILLPCMDNQTGWGKGGVVCGERAYAVFLHCCLEVHRKCWPPRLWEVAVGIWDRETLLEDNKYVVTAGEWSTKVDWRGGVVTLRCRNEVAVGRRDEIVEDDRKSIFVVEGAGAVS